MGDGPGADGDGGNAGTAQDEQAVLQHCQYIDVQWQYAAHEAARHAGADDAVVEVACRVALVGREEPQGQEIDPDAKQQEERNVVHSVVLAHKGDDARQDTDHEVANDASAERFVGRVALEPGVFPCVQQDGGTIDRHHDADQEGQDDHRSASLSCGALSSPLQCKCPLSV